MLQNSTSILDSIHSHVFLKSADHTINIFLCGASVSDPNSIRNLIHRSIRDIGKTNVVLPEWLFSDLMAKPQYNLLGAFASFPTIRGKIIVIIDTGHKRTQSFVNLGPIKLIKQEHPDNVMYYDNNNTHELIDKVITRIKYLKNPEPKSAVNNLFNLSRFVLFLIAIFQPVSKQDIRDMILNWKSEIAEHYIEPCLTILINDKRVLISNIHNYTDFFSLTEKGHSHVFENILPGLGVTKQFNKIRTQVLNAKYRERRKPNLVQERERLLELS